MRDFVVFIHVLSASGLGFYFFFPFLLHAASSLHRSTAEGYMKVLFTMNRIGQYVLIVAFLSGGYLVSKSGYSTAWMIVSVVLVVMIGAMSGMMTKPMKRLLPKLKDGQDNGDKEFGKLRIFSSLAAASLLAITILMIYPNVLS